MNARRILQGALFAVLAVSAFLLLRPAADATVSAPAEPVVPYTGGVVLDVTYFHGDIRCDTCRSIEEQCEKAVRAAFAPELASGRMVWNAVNYDRPENAALNEQFGLTHATLYLIERDGGETVRFAPLDDVWDLVFENGKIAPYVQGEIRGWLEPGSSR